MGTADSSERTLTARHWDHAAADYDALAEVQERWGRRVLARTPIRDDEVVLDAGCGSGRLLELLVERVPRGRVYAVDQSPDMLAAARQRLEANAALREKLSTRVQFLHGSLDELDLPHELLPPGMPRLPANRPSVVLPESANLIFCNAVLHWLPDWTAVFARWNRVLADGGRVVAQYAAPGHLRLLRAAIYRAARLEGLSNEAANWVRFKTVAAPDAADQLKLCGFRHVRVWDEDEEAEFADAETFIRFVDVVLLGTGQTLDEPRRAAFLARLQEEAFRLLGRWRLDARRQNITADK